MAYLFKDDSAPQQPDASRSAIYWRNAGMFLMTPVADLCALQWLVLYTFLALRIVGFLLCSNTPGIQSRQP